MNTNTHHEHEEREGGTRRESSHPKSHRGGEQRKKSNHINISKVNSWNIYWPNMVQSKPFQSQPFKMNNVFDEYFAVNISLASTSPATRCRLLPVLDSCNNPQDCHTFTRRNYDPQAARAGLKIINSLSLNLIYMGSALAKIIGSHFHIITLSGQMLPRQRPDLPRLWTRPLAWTGAKQEAYYQQFSIHSSTERASGMQNSPESFQRQSASHKPTTSLMKTATKVQTKKAFMMF